MALTRAAPNLLGKPSSAIAETIAFGAERDSLRRNQNENRDACTNVKLTLISRDTLYAHMRFERPV